MYLNWNSDGCPNNCAYCHENNLPCVYTEEGKMRNYRCEICGKAIANDETYDYRDHVFCAECLLFGRCITEIERKNADAGCRQVYDELYDDLVRSCESGNQPNMIGSFLQIFQISIQVTDRYDFMLPNILNYMQEHPIKKEWSAEIQKHLDACQAAIIDRWIEMIRSYYKENLL